RIVAVFDRGAVHQVLAPMAAIHRRPEIIQHVAMEADALAGLEPDGPHPQLVGLGEKLGADAAVRLFGLAREFGFQRGRPLGLDVAVRRLLFHGHRHGVSPHEYELSYSKFRLAEECVWRRGSARW